MLVVLLVVELFVVSRINRDCLSKTQITLGDAIPTSTTDSYAVVVANSLTLDLYVVSGVIEAINSGPMKSGQTPLSPTLRVRSWKRISLIANPFASGIET